VSEFSSTLRLFFCGCVACLCLNAQSGYVRSGNQPIPGATVTATQGNQKVSTVTDADGHFFLPVETGDWKVEITMFGFDPLRQTLKLSPAQAVHLQLKLTESPLAARLRQSSSSQGPDLLSLSNLPGAGSQSAASAQTELQNALNGTAPAQFNSDNRSNSGNDSFLVSGSLSQGLAQNAPADTNGFGLPGGPGFGPGAGELSASQSGNAFGSEGSFGGSGRSVPNGGGGFGGGSFGGRGGGGPRGGPGVRARTPGFRASTFGNRRRANQIHGMLSYEFGNSAVNAKPFSITGQEVAQPAYAQNRFSAVVGGPLVIPKLVNDPSTFFFLSYFGTRNRTPNTFTETVPTALERGGDFSQSIQSGGPVQIFNPSTHQPFAGNVLPPSLLSPISLNLLTYLPLPNQPGIVNNYQYLVSTPQNTDNIGLRLQRNLTRKDRLSYQLNLQNRDSTTPRAYGFQDPVTGFGLRTSLSWSHNYTPTVINNLQFSFNRNRMETVPYFANGPDVASQLGIQGTSSNPLNFGPPNLNFTNIGALTDASPTLSRNQSQSMSEGVVVNRGKHTVSFGLSFQRNDLATQTDQNGRGTFTFTGFETSQLNANGQPVAATGYDFADFLLGVPQSAAITYGNSNLYFNQNVVSSYVQDDYRIHPRLSLIVGLRYEYFQPFTEKYGVLTNLDIAPNYTGVAVVTPESNVGPYSGAFSAGLINRDYNNFGPRVGLAWKVPGIKRSTIIRAGYGIYYNGQAYNQFALRLAQQPPFATSNNVVSSADGRLTIADGFLGAIPGKNLLNTYAVDRNYRTPNAQTWTFSIQHDLSHGMFVEGTYTGTKGTNLDVYLSPNSAPPRTSLTSENRLPISNATTFTYDTPVGNSSYNGMMLRFSERFNRGISFRATYTFSKSIDDASTFAGTVAQDFRDIAAERGLSSFDRRHVFDANWVFTSRFRNNETTLLADLLKGWMLTGSVTAETGLPLTARVLGNQSDIAGSGNVGSGRASATGQGLSSGAGFFNLAAFTAPVPGQYGNAGRNTIPGPGLFSLNAGFGRSFQFGESRRRLEFRAEATNLLNQVNYTSFNTVVNATNYGLPVAAGNMRQLSAVIRFRF
jgi:trimeric autotransporter adhesin